MKRKHAGNALIRYSSIGMALALMACLLLAACSASKPATPDGYLWKDDTSSNGRVHVQSVDGSSIGVLSVDEGNAAEVNSVDGTFCVADLQRVAWHGASLSGSPDAHRQMAADNSPSGPLAPPIAPMPPMIRLDRHGQCLFPVGTAQLGIISTSKPSGATVNIGTGNFTWNSLAYAPATDSLALIGDDQFAVVQNVASLGQIPTVKVHGTAMGLTADSLSCCAKLSPDGKTLYSIAEVGDTNLSGHTVLGAFDAATGEFKRVYLPYFPDLPDCSRISDADEHAECEKNSSFPGLDFPPGKSIELESGEPQAFDLSPDGQTLYALAFIVDSSSDDNQQSQVMAIDTHSGKVTPLPIVAYGAFAVSASGKYLFVEDATTLTSLYAKGMDNHGKPPAAEKDAKHPIRVYALPSGQFVRELSGEHLIGALKKLN